eukprot:4446575-Amphidinium_carterae.1
MRPQPEEHKGRARQAGLSCQLSVNGKPAYHADRYTLYGRKFGSMSLQRLPVKIDGDMLDSAA